MEEGKSKPLTTKGTKKGLSIPYSLFPMPYLLPAPCSLLP